MKTVNNFKNLTGKKFNKLIVISRNNKKSKNSLWNCECECGNTIIVSRCNLISGNTTSCGCNKSFLLRKAREKNLTNKKFGKLIVISKSKKKKRE
ncbi:hypothetical protein EII25_03440 [Erysipelotrichaceae bacterium OH741_COT-311]|nr:hypothetical protein EII25_03440 [Erysipelotrichaceae bacterium OH741_COT-311]